MTFDGGKEVEGEEFCHAIFEGWVDTWAKGLRKVVGPAFYREVPFCSISVHFYRA